MLKFVIKVIIDVFLKFIRGRGIFIMGSNLDIMFMFINI